MGRVKPLIFTIAMTFASFSHADLQQELDALATVKGGPSIPPVTTTLFDQGRWRELFRVSPTGPMSCENFDPIVSVKESFNSSVGRVRQTLETIPDAVKASINPTSLAAAIMQRSSPQLYEQMMNGISIGFEDFKMAKDICNAAQQTILDQIPSSSYEKAAQSKQMQGITAAVESGQQIDIVDIFGGKDQTKSLDGNLGIDTPRGPRGGSGTPPFKVNEVAGDGYKKILETTQEQDPVLVINKQSPKTARDYFKNENEVVQYIDKVIGSISIRTCDNCEKREITAGLGVQNLVLESATKFHQSLTEVVRKPIGSLSDEDLASVSVYPYLTTSATVIRRLKSETAVERNNLISSLAYDLANAEQIQMMGYAKQMLMVGKSSPEYTDVAGLQTDVDAQIELLDLQIATIQEDAKNKQILSGQTLKTIIDRANIKRKYADTPIRNF